VSVWAVPVDERLIDGAPDYADAFAVRVDVPDGRTAEEWLRVGLEQAPVVLRWVILAAHRHVLRFRLGPRSSPQHVLGWRIAESTPEVVRLTAAGPLIDGVIVARKPGPTSLLFTTCVYYRRPSARPVWRLLRPVHRGVARYLLARAAVTEQPLRTVTGRAVVIPG
jgi:hypothetical protein